MTVTLGARVVAAKLAIEMAVLHPAALLCFFTFVGITSGGEMKKEEG